MFQRFLNFIKYNNFAVLILLAFFVFGGGVFAQTEAGKEIIGREKTEIAGVDNTVLLEVDLDDLDMNYRIENIQEDDTYYYVTYTFLDLIERENAWQYIVQEKIRKVSKKSRVDLPDFLAKEFKQMYEAKIKYLKREKEKAEKIGAEKRKETKKYGGLIGKSLDVVGSVFVDFETVKVRELPSPTIPPTVLPKKKNIAKNSDDENLATADSITDVYEDYIDRKDPDRDNVFGVLDNCPDVYNPDQLDSDGNGVGDACEDDLNNKNNKEDTEGTEDIEDDGNITDIEEDIEDDGNIESPHTEASEEKDVDNNETDTDQNNDGSVDDGDGSENDVEDIESLHTEASEEKDVDNNETDTDQNNDGSVDDGDGSENDVEDIESPHTEASEDNNDNGDDGANEVDEEPDVIIVELE